MGQQTRTEEEQMYDAVMSTESWVAALGISFIVSGTVLIRRSIRTHEAW